MGFTVYGSRSAIRKGFYGRSSTFHPKPSTQKGLVTKLIFHKKIFYSTTINDNQVKKLYSPTLRLCNYILLPFLILYQYQNAYSLLRVN